MLYSLVVNAAELHDADLVRQIAAGEAPEAEAELYRRLAPRVHLYGLRHLRDEQGAWDLVQNVLLRTLETAREGGVREPEKLASFVLGTCRMVVLDLRRGAQRRQQLLDQFARETASVQLPSIPEVDDDRLVQCLHTLAERDRTVIVLSFYDEQTSAEVGRSLGISEANVRVIRHRALARLRECMS